MKVLITGINGMLGSKIAASLVNNKKYEIYGLARAKTSETHNVTYSYFDLTDKEKLGSAVKDFAPDVIIHCAANVNINDCDINKGKAFSIHVDSSEMLALTAPAARFIYISTDSVYDGMRGNYSELDNTAPVNYYAQTKLLGEQAVLQNSKNAIILRTNMYGFSKPRRSSLAEWAISSLERGETINGFEDVFFNPLYIGQLADCVEAIIPDVQKGVMNVGCMEEISKYDFLLKIAKVFNFNTGLIKKSSVDHFEALKNRPKNTTLNTLLLNTTPGLSFSIDEGIDRLHQDYKSTFYE